MQYNSTREGTISLCIKQIVFLVVCVPAIKVNASSLSVCMRDTEFNYVSINKHIYVCMYVFTVSIYICISYMYNKQN